MSRPHRRDLRDDDDVAAAVADGGARASSALSSREENADGPAPPPRAGDGEREGATAEVATADDAAPRGGEALRDDSRADHRSEEKEKEKEKEKEIEEIEEDEEEEEGADKNYLTALDLEPVARSTHLDGATPTSSSFPVFVSPLVARFAQRVVARRAAWRERRRSHAGRCARRTAARSHHAQNLCSAMAYDPATPRVIQA